MPVVMGYTRKLTGRTKVMPGLFGPKLMVEEEVYSWDTNSAAEGQKSFTWRKAKNADLDQFPSWVLGRKSKRS